MKAIYNNRLWAMNHDGVTMTEVKAGIKETIDVPWGHPQLIVDPTDGDVAMLEIVGLLPTPKP